MSGFGWGGCCGFGGLGWIGWIINIVLTVGILIGLVLLVIWAIRKITSSQPGSIVPTAQGSGQPTARDILQARYARGEINREEYLQMLEDIR